MVTKLDHKVVTIAQAIHSLSIAAYTIEAKIIGADPFPPLHERIDSILNSPSTFWGIYDADDLVGAIEIESGTSTVISRLVVNPNNFREGIAKKLLTFVLQDGGQFIVTTATANAPAIRLYKDMFGFSLTHRFEVDQGLELSEFELHT